MIGVNQGGHNDWNVWYFVLVKFKGIAILLEGGYYHNRSWWQGVEYRVEWFGVNVFHAVL
jgi:hypothetical protein